METEERSKPEFVFRKGMTPNKEYVEWLTSVKNRYVNARAKASVQVNSELLGFYWSLGRDFATMNMEETYGKGIMANISKDLQDAFPGQKGFSLVNLHYMKRWYIFYFQHLEKFYQPGKISGIPDDFALVPWRHHVEIISKCHTVAEGLFYIQKTIACNWSRRMLEDNIASNLYARQGAAVTNFSSTLPVPQSGLAQEILKDPYNFDFLTMQKGYDERELENALVRNITRFLLELGKGFAFVGRQMELRMASGQTFFPDLVFYHIPQKRYVVIDLKAVGFKPEFAGKINFYVSAADELLRGEGDNDSIGLIICKEADRTVVEWSFRGVERPLGVATYQLQEVVDRTVAELGAMNQHVPADGANNHKTE